MTPGLSVTDEPEQTTGGATTPSDKPTMQAGPPATAAPKRTEIVESPRQTESSGSNPKSLYAQMAERAKSNLEQQNSSEPSPKPTSISLYDFARLRDKEDGMPPIERERQIEAQKNRKVDWIGFYQDLSLNTDNDEQYFTIYVQPHSENDFIWPIAFSQPRRNEPIISSLEKGQPIRFSGKLTSRMHVDVEILEPLETSPVSMAEYLEMLTGGKEPVLDVMNKHVGKFVDWNGYLLSLETYPRDEKRRFRVIIKAQLQGNNEYVYCYLPASAERNLSALKLKADSSLRVTGILSRRSYLELATILPPKE